MKGNSMKRTIAAIIATVVVLSSASPVLAKDFCIDNDDVCKLTSSLASKPKGQKSYLGNCSDINGFGTGYDKFTSLVFDTEYGNNVVTTNSKTGIELTLSLNCAVDSQYLPRLMLSKGPVTKLVALSPYDFVKENSLDYPIRNFCYTNSCYIATYTGELNLPEGTSLGDYTVKLSVVPTDDNIFSKVTSSFTYKNGLSVKSSYSEEPKKLDAGLNASKAAGYSYCYMDEITAEAIEYYGITATDWTVKLRYPSGKLVELDKFEIAVQSSASAEQTIAEEKNGYSGLFILDGLIKYTYVPYKQVKGATLICSTTVKAASGDWLTNTKSSKMPRNGSSIK